MTETDPAERVPTWRVDVSRHCISSGICLRVAPEHFEFVGVRARPVSPLIHSAEEAEAVTDAENDCPVGAISVTQA